jgi:hypothetical protein
MKWFLKDLPWLWIIVVALFTVWVVEHHSRPVLGPPVSAAAGSVSIGRFLDSTERPVIMRIGEVDYSPVLIPTKELQEQYRFR